MKRGLGGITGESIRGLGHFGTASEFILLREMGEELGVKGLEGLGLRAGGLLVAKLADERDGERGVCEVEGVVTESRESFFVNGTPFRIGFGEVSGLDSMLCFLSAERR